MIVGIDLGTTHSLIGAYGPQGPSLFTNALGSTLTPSVVSVDEDERIIIGQPARDRLITHAASSVATFKRWMGSEREVRLGNHRLRPEELSALLLRQLLADAEAALGTRVEEAVISVPAYFSDAQRKATRAAGEIAGIRVERLVNEPTAAALAYGLQHRSDGGRFLVLDLGGGTFDVSILEIFEGVVEVHASAGDNYLGGEDFLDLLYKTLCTDLDLDPTRLQPRDRARIRQRCEQAKRELSSRQAVHVRIPVDGATIEWEIDQSRFAQLAEPLMQRMRAPVERAMRDARLQSSQVDEVVLVGGATRMPMVARLVSRMFGRLPLRDVNPDEAVARGVAIAAGLKSRDARLEEVILTDVCPYTLGTQVAQIDGAGRYQAGFFQPIIHRNSTVPVSREETFWPVEDHQSRLRIDVYQGENPMVANNIKLGALDVELPPRRSKDQNGVAVRFTYDVNGVLQVEATVLASGRRFELLLEQNPGLLSQEEIRERLRTLDALKIHPRDQHENMAATARAERVYEEHVDQRHALSERLASFRGALEAQDSRLIREERRALLTLLDHIETAS
ncbi:MAG: molecular chaperone HscC [Rhodanobacter denitrificans]|uniref:Molecular chaperone HscC n=1 Tax=Rhodanobacter denitrificans TaxID=666685 RepID=A0A2W5K4G4_9GAMM|nr:MAG: molecular chaperone HscC [Rhodanobacter denitrificans]